MLSPLFFTLGLAATVGAVPVQGTLSGADGAPLNGTRTVTFRLFDDETAGGEVYADDFEVAFVDGAFAAWLGSGDEPLDVEVFADDLWLEVELAGGPPAARVGIGWATRAGVAANALKFGGVAFDDFTLPWSKVTGKPLPASCANGEVAAWSTAAGAWTCAVRNNLTAGSGISLTGGQISVDLNSFWNLSRLSCADSQVPRWNNSTGAWTCADMVTPAALAAAVSTTTLPRVQFGTVSAPSNADCGTTYPAGAVVYTAQGFLGCTASGWQSFGSARGSEFNPGTSCKDIKTQTGSNTSGLYWVASGAVAKQQVWCDMTTDGGGWTLVASNAASDTTIPAGTGRNSALYTIAASIRGTPNPANDYTIGAMVDAISFTEARISGDRASQTERIDFKFPCTSRACTTNSGASGVITDLNSVNITFYAFLQHSTPLTCTLDAVARDVALNANSNQSTLGGACVQATNGDPGDGCYVGHGASEGSFEGWHDDFPSGGYTNVDADRYATWVR